MHDLKIAVYCNEQSNQTSHGGFSSFSAPLEASLVLTTNGEKFVASVVENSAHNVLTMSGIGARLMRVVDDWIVEDVQKTPIVSRGKESSLFAHSNAVYM